jgi:hypothetical protein
MDARMAVPLFSTSSSESAFRQRTFRGAAGLRLSFGDIALGVFLLTQLLDGVYTYFGVRTFGMHAEGNPIIATLITHLGNGPTLLSAKVAASGMGICLYLCGTHALVALLAGLYLAASITPWTLIFFF